jgi:imidazolonepropionase-like amidohydrolase
MTNWMLLKDGDLLDGRSDELRRGQSVLVRDDVVHEVGSSADELRSRVPRDERLVELDARGKTLMPGLIDAHCHMTYGESKTQEEMDLYTSVELRTLVAASNFRRVLRAGVTSISQPGGSYYIGVGLREGKRLGLVQGPRMFAAGRYISTSNGLTDYYPISVGSPLGGIGMRADTLPEMLAEVRRQVKSGVDLIKLADSPYGQYQSFTGDEMKAIVDLTHQLGRRATIHARGSAEVSAAVDAGFDWIMHGNVMTDEVIEKLAESRIPLVPTLLLLGNLADWGDRFGAPPNQRDGCRRMLEKTGPTLHKARQAGVTLLAGTDTGFSVTPFGEWHARELQLLQVYAGMTNAEAIRSMTSGAAVTVGMEGRLGEVAEGMVADLLVVNGDPLADLSVLVDRRNIQTVIQGGRVVEFEERDFAERHPHPERIYEYNHTPITYEAIFGEGDPVGELPIDWSGDEAKQLASELHRAELDSRAVADA